MAIQERFRRCLPGVPKDQRYSSLILDDLIDEACEWVEEKPYLCLFVHPDNIGAIHLYERHNFARLQKPYVDPETGVAYLRMFTRLQISDGLAVE